MSFIWSFHSCIEVPFEMSNLKNAWCATWFNILHGLMIQNEQCIICIWIEPNNIFCLKSFNQIDLGVALGKGATGIEVLSLWIVIRFQFVVFIYLWSVCSVSVYSATETFHSLLHSHWDQLLLCWYYNVELCTVQNISLFENEYYNVSRL